jgi:hypothetical protein
MYQNEHAAIYQFGANGILNNVVTDEVHFTVEQMLTVYFLFQLFHHILTTNK